MKNLKLALLPLVVALVILARQFFSSGDGKTLHIVSWSQYLPKPFLEKFTATTGIKVQVHLISSNEELFAKLKAGATGYDLMQPSDYMVERLAKLKMLAPLDKSKLPRARELSDQLTNVPYDRGLVYSLPFLEGSTGLIVNTKKVTLPPDGLSWSAVFESADPRNTYLMDDMREVFAAALMWKGKNPNVLDDEAVQLARNTLFAAKDHVISFNSEPVGLVQREEITVAHAFSYQAAEAHRLKPHLKYVLPKEGAIQWVDTMVLTADAKHVPEAYAFLNYVMEPDNATELQRLNGFNNPYSTPESRVREPAATQGPPKDKLYFLRHIQDDSLERVSRAWTEIKAG